MSTLTYAALTTKREKAAPNTSTSKAPPGVSTYLDAVAALVPAEVLTLHGVILTFTTTTKESSTTITDGNALCSAFFGLIVLGVLLYVVPRFQTWEPLDYLRMFIPPVAFLAWTMLQRATAFDALIMVWKGLDTGQAGRSVIALFIAVGLGVLATALAYKADQKKP